MVTTSELLAAVDAAFEITGRRTPPWPDPHPKRSPADEEYSQVTDPAKWRILGARADAWLTALADAGLADVDPDVQVRWADQPRPVVTGTEHVLPRASAAIPLVIARSRIESVPDAGVTIGVGDPAVCIAWIPDCGCDACDSGSQCALDELDEHLTSVVTGAFRRLTSGTRTIQVIDGYHRGWSASGRFRRGEVATIVADPTGWRELSGASWLDL